MLPVLSTFCHLCFSYCSVPALFSFLIKCVDVSQRNTLCTCEHGCLHLFAHTAEMSQDRQKDTARQSKQRSCLALEISFPTAKSDQRFRCGHRAGKRRKSEKRRWTRRYKRGKIQVACLLLILSANDGEQREIPSQSAFRETLLTLIWEMK